MHPTKVIRAGHARVGKGHKPRASQRGIDDVGRQRIRYAAKTFAQCLGRDLMLLDGRCIGGPLRWCRTGYEACAPSRACKTKDQHGLDKGIRFQWHV